MVHESGRFAVKVVKKRKEISALFAVTELKLVALDCAAYMRLYGQAMIVVAAMHSGGRRCCIHQKPAVGI